MNYFLLLIFAILWCTLHSLLISIRTTSWFKWKLGKNYKYFRISYNIFSFLSLIALMLFEKSLATSLLFDWNFGYLQLLQVLLLMLSLLLFYLGAKQYDGMEFLGIRQLKHGFKSKTLSTSGKIQTKGILGVIRHPWYTASIIIIWLRPLYVSSLIINLVFTLYFIVGSFLEETKLRKEFGAEYTDYQKRVSMLLPWKWFQRIFLKR